ncbi:DEAD/DEAH box helicase [Tropicibacter oceani]|uniref:DEAD/DEAH box helicase n=1 Tax=Tropicibacter oceani TaxID=3058420 RepID=A0ABY8QI17_9RHOB|nr:DEAD/DEAH box helicase [Tropicibacter oceani]WGW03646.1 DEAD/DEAH box helicase [Tropicibacter oceani]
MISTLSDALAERGYDQLTDVQEAVTAPELSEADLLVSAQTGSGKTVGFGLAIAPTLLGEDARFGPPAAPLALIVAPTRELAMQVQRELEWLFGKAGGRIAACIGGMDARQERRTLERGAHIVVGTPGRLRDHIMRGALDLTDIRAVVLDEADEMLDLGFREDLEYMLGEAPQDRRTLMFSATVSDSIAKMAEQFQRDAQRISTITGKAQHADIAYQAIQVTQRDAEHAIINLLRFHDAPNAIVFANTRATVARLTARLANRGLSVVSLSGELSQDERSHALQALRDGRAKVCVATDVAARGIDLPNLELVIHADLPQNTEALLHRSGRTGRAGRKGISALIVPDKISKKAARLLKWAKIEAEWTHAPGPEDILAKDEARLLADPVWNTAPTEQEAGFAAKLLAEYGAEKVAAACLSFFRAGLSAPEELNQPEARAPREDRGDFGPSAWFSLSIGRDKGAEARWLLPLILRVGNFEKANIGRIRVQDQETFVELSESVAADFLGSLGPDGLLENDVFGRQLDAEPAEIRQPPAHRGRPAQPHRKGPGGDRGDRGDRGDKKPWQGKPRSDDREKPRAPRPDRADKPARPAGEAATAHPARSERPARDDKPRDAKPYGKPAGKPAAKRDGKPFGKPEGKPAGKRDAKPYGKPEGKPAAKRDGKPFGKPEGKSFGKSEGKPFDKKGGKPAGKPGAKPGKPRPANAMDTSVRMDRPGSKGPGSKGPGKGKPVNRGGDSPLRRKPKSDR